MACVGVLLLLLLLPGQAATFLGKEKPDAEERDARFRGTRHSARADCLVPLAADFTECRALPGRVVPLR
ncbi:unnamed protein product [Lampetra fluviatilis]